MKEIDPRRFVDDVLRGVERSEAESPTPEDLCSFLASHEGRELLLQRKELGSRARKRLTALLNLLRKQAAPTAPDEVADLPARQRRGEQKLVRAFEEQLLTLPDRCGRTLQDRLGRLLDQSSPAPARSEDGQSLWTVLPAQVHVATTDLGTLCLRRLPHRSKDRVTLWRHNGIGGGDGRHVTSTAALEKIQAGTGWSANVAREVYDWIFDVARHRHLLLTGVIIDGWAEDRLLVRRPTPDELAEVRRAAADPNQRWRPGKQVRDIAHLEAQTTGRILVTIRAADFRAEMYPNLLARLRNTDSGDDSSASAERGSIYFAKLGIWVTREVEGLLSVVDEVEQGTIDHIEPEFYVSAVNDSHRPYLPTPGGKLSEVEQGLDSDAGQSHNNALEVAEDASLTWGLQAMGVNQARHTGRGIKVAVLDTGFDLSHPDFRGRRIVTRTFIRGQDVQDRNGHGTRCVGVACGPMRPRGFPRVPRYGIAYDSDIFIGKVLDDSGRGVDANVISGIDWALSNDCDIILLPLGSPVGCPSTAYEQIAQQALRAGSIIIAPAGNGRGDEIAPAIRPANAPSMIAVYAVDEKLDLCGVSERQIAMMKNIIAAPGVNILSASPGSAGYERSNGTSMAASHVAGVAALMAEAHPKARGFALVHLLTMAARSLPSRISEGSAVPLLQAPG